MTICERMDGPISGSTVVVRKDSLFFTVNPLQLSVRKGILDKWKNTSLFIWIELFFLFFSVFLTSGCYSAVPGVLERK
jgi:hypothetical protein